MSFYVFYSECHEKANNKILVGISADNTEDFYLKTSKSIKECEKK